MRWLRFGLLSITAMLAALLLALVLFWPALVPRLTFMARELPPEHRSPAAWRYVGDEVHFRSSDDVALHGWFLHRSTPEGEPCGTVLFLPGIAGNEAWQAGFTPHLTRHGLDVLLFDYRGYGASEGTPSEEGLHRDALGAYSYPVRLASSHRSGSCWWDTPSALQWR
jgi:pimeloyl-ACP methyl ester carboxylesterase